MDRSWAQVQNVYQRRADLVPNLVATVSGAANFEKSTLTEITAARASVGQVKCGEISWRQLADAMSGYFHKSEFTPGILHSVPKAGELLAEHFPRQRG